jgi:hypothetical protein
MVAKKRSVERQLDQVKREKKAGETVNLSAGKYIIEGSIFD